MTNPVDDFLNEEDPNGAKPEQVDMFGAPLAKAERNAKGHFIKGNPTPCSRKKLPEWFRASGEKALRLLSAAATGEAQLGDNPVVKALAMDCEPQHRIKAAQIVTERVFGKPKEQKYLMDDEVDFSEIDKENQVKILESFLGRAAAAGDLNAATTLLKALAPEKYNRKTSDGAGGDDEQVDGVIWTSEA